MFFIVQGFWVGSRAQGSRLAGSVFGVAGRDDWLKAQKWFVALYAGLRLGAWGSGRNVFIWKAT